MEKLARRICWLGFSRIGRKGKTEATYWASLPKETHESYLREAELFVSNYRQIAYTRSSQRILDDALRETRS